MFFLGTKTKAAHSAGSDRELRRLSRQDLLELLLEQMHEGDRLREDITELEQASAEQANLIDRLKAKLDVKDEQIARLQVKLDEKDELLEKAVSLAHDIVARSGKRGDAYELEELEYLLAQHFLKRATPYGREASDIEELTLLAEPTPSPNSRVAVPAHMANVPKHEAANQEVPLEGVLS